MIIEIVLVDGVREGKRCTYLFKPDGDLVGEVVRVAADELGHGAVTASDRYLADGLDAGHVQHLVRAACTTNTTTVIITPIPTYYHFDTYVILTYKMVEDNDKV